MGDALTRHLLIAAVRIRDDALCYGADTEDAIKTVRVAWQALSAALEET